MNVMIVVTHLLGSGHLRRALTLARTFAEAGHRAQVVSGGLPVPHLDHSGVEMRQLPPLRSHGTDFTTLLDDEGSPASDAYRAARRDALCAALAEQEPDILITELFPFGRRSLSEEFLALLERAETLPRRPLILASVRDILAPPSHPAKAERADEVIARHYDAVLVHSDPYAVQLDYSWPVSEMLAKKLRYTGFVTDEAPAPHPAAAGTGEVLISAGGGPVGTRLFEIAVDASRLMPKQTWRLLVGGSDARDRIRALQERAGDSNTIVEPTRPDFRQMLHHAAASVSMCGYNTAMDLLQIGTPAVLVPFDAGKEVEQSLRARGLERLPGIVTLSSDALTADALSLAVIDVMSESRRGSADLRFDGAGRSVRIACALAEETR